MKMAVASPGSVPTDFTMIVWLTCSSARLITVGVLFSSIHRSITSQNKNI